MTPSSGADPRLVASIRELLAAREAGKTICPSEAARAVGGDDWRELMQPARDAARELVDRGEVEVTQKGVVVDVTSARGPVRIRRKD
ncbi:DUF3253 domain-containing protein [uncultured Microbacterium sp.]|uniref:DUF3253 domain-containing protein n=1 Tax=uncultured Microbacterium sp. TaxID=191216 RepID=UPI0025E845C0|nr:DUF3253 domain-containing protein [uncultured Microbacterium sp.]